jgi:hypothetical protein
MHEAGEGTQTILATTRTLVLQPSEATSAVAACVGSEIRLNLPAGARAVLRRRPLQGASARDRSLLVGSVRSRRGWVSVPVEIETAPVSSSCCELVVRPVGPLCLRSQAHRRLFDRCSHALADFFRMEIELAGLAAVTPLAPGRTSPPADAPVWSPA